MLDLVKEVFNNVYFQIYGMEYLFKNERVEKLLNDFLDKVNTNIGEGWLLEFVVFQFSYYDGMKTRFDRIYLNWIFGEKAIDRWNNRTEQQVYFADEFKKKLGIKKEFESINIRDYIESEKLRFEDIYQRLIHCDELSLFIDDSDICKCCLFYQKCKIHEQELC